MAVMEARGSSLAPPTADHGRSLAPVSHPAHDLVEGPVGTKAYWLGVLDQCPMEVVTLGGIAFCRRTHSPYYVEGERTPRKVERRGQILHLTEEQIEAVKANARTKLVRRTGRRAEIVQATGSANRRFIRYPSDEPIGTFVYCVPVDEAADLLGPGWQDHGSPPPLMAPNTPVEVVEGPETEEDREAREVREQAEKKQRPGRRGRSK